MVPPGCAGRIKYPPVLPDTRAVLLGVLQPRWPLLLPRAVRIAPFASGRSTAANAGCYADIATRSSRSPSIRMARAWPQPAAIGRSGFGTWQPGKRSPGWRGIRVMCAPGVQPGRQDTHFRFRRRHGAPVGYRAASQSFSGAAGRRGERPQAEELVEELFKQQRDATAVGATLWTEPTLSEPLRHAAFRAPLAPAVSVIGAPVSQAKSGVRGHHTDLRLWIGSPEFGEPYLSPNSARRNGQMWQSGLQRHPDRLATPGGAPPQGMVRQRRDRPDGGVRDVRGSAAINDGAIRPEPLIPKVGLEPTRCYPTGF